MSETNKHIQTPCEALGVKNITDKEKDEIYRVAEKSLMEPDYCKSDAIVDIIKALGEKDTPGTRRCMACLYSFVETVCEMDTKMKEFIDSMSGGERKK